MSEIPRMLKVLLRQIVYHQDAGVPVAEELSQAFFSLSTIDRIMVEADIERHRMARDGLKVYTRDTDTAFILGLEDKPYRKSE